MEDKYKYTGELSSSSQPFLDCLVRNLRQACKASPHTHTMHVEGEGNANNLDLTHCIHGPSYHTVDVNAIYN